MSGWEGNGPAIPRIPRPRKPIDPAPKPPVNYDEHGYQVPQPSEPRFGWGAPGCLLAR